MQNVSASSEDLAKRLKSFAEAAEKITIFVLGGEQIAATQPIAVGKDFVAFELANGTPSIIPFSAILRVDAAWYPTPAG